MLLFEVPFAFLNMSPLVTVELPGMPLGNGLSELVGISDTKPAILAVDERTAVSLVVLADELPLPIAINIHGVFCLRGFNGEALRSFFGSWIAMQILSEVPVQRAMTDRPARGEM